MDRLRNASSSAARTSLRVGGDVPAAPEKTAGQQAVDKLNTLKGDRLGEDTFKDTLIRARKSELHVSEVAFEVGSDGKGGEAIIIAMYVSRADADKGRLSQYYAGDTARSVAGKMDFHNIPRKLCLQCWRDVREQRGRYRQRAFLARYIHGLRLW